MLPTELTQERIAYYAGFFDGEGCVYLAKDKGGRPCCDEARWGLRVSIVNTYKPILEQIQQHYGGRVKAVIRSKKEENRRKAWVWILHSKNIGKFLTDITPHLVEKQARANAALFFCDTLVWPKNWRSLTENAKYLRQLAVKAMLQHPNLRSKDSVKNVAA